MRDVRLPEVFLEKGGTEVAPMSTTADLRTAVRYAASRSSVLLRLLADSFITRGADISYLSAFPSESEYLYPPLAYLKPARTKPVVYQRGEKLKFVVIDVVPYM